MKDKGIGTGIVIIIIVIVVVAGGIGGYMVMSGGDSTESGSPTEGTTGEEPEETGGTSGGEAIVNWASSVDFTVTATDNESGELQYEHRYRARQLDTSTPDIRKDRILIDGTTTENHILLGSESKGWVQTERWTPGDYEALYNWVRISDFQYKDHSYSQMYDKDFSDVYSESLSYLKTILDPSSDPSSDTYDMVWGDLYTDLRDIEGNGIVTSSGGLRIHDIEINPTFSDDVFSPS